jgi:hypothetical protein
MADEATHTFPASPLGQVAGGFGRVTREQQASTCGAGAVFQTASDSRTGDRHNRRQAVLDCHVAPGFAALRVRQALAYAVN